MSGYNGVAVDLPTFLPPGNFAWAECKHSGHCSRIFGNPDITTCRLMDMLKYQTSGSWASIDQVSSTAPIEGTGHVLELWCSTALLQMHRASALHMSTYFTPGNPGQKQNHLSLLLLSPSISSLLQVTAAFPSLPWLCQGPCWAWRVGLLCHHLHQSPASTAGTCPEQPHHITFANKEIKLLLQMLPFYQVSRNVCCSCTWTSGARELRENCNFSFSKKLFQIRTLQLKKCKLSDHLTGDYCLSKHIE